MLTYIEEKSHLSSPALIPSRYLCCKKYLKNPADGIFNIVWHFCYFFYYQILLVPLLNSVRSAIVRWWGEVTKIDSLGECLQPSSLQLTVQRFGKQSKERNSLKEFGMFSLSSLLVNKSTAKIKYNIHGYITNTATTKIFISPLKICFERVFL